MALLRRVRQLGGGRRLSWRPGRTLALVLIVALGSACSRSDARLRPDQLLRDSLGLGDDDRVHRIRLASQDNREAPDPDSVLVRPGDYVEFFSADRRVHAVSFVLAGLSPAALDFLRGTSQESSPPLVEPEARFVVTFANAPPGRYPFVIAGNGTEGQGLIVVGEPSR